MPVNASGGPAKVQSATTSPFTWAARKMASGASGLIGGLVPGGIGGLGGALFPKAPVITVPSQAPTYHSNAESSDLMAQAAGAAAAAGTQQDKYAALGLTQAQPSGTYADELRARALERSQGLSGLAGNFRNEAIDARNRVAGPSVAEAQLREGEATNLAQSLAMAKSGRGLGQSEAALTDAAFRNQAIGAQTNQAQAILRAQEAAEFQKQKDQVEQYYQSLGMTAEQAATQAEQGLSGLSEQGYGQAADINAKYAALGVEGMKAYQDYAARLVQLGQTPEQAQLQADTAFLGQQVDVMKANQGAQQAQSKQNLGVGLGAVTGILGMLSDIRAKTDITPTTPNTTQYMGYTNPNVGLYAQANGPKQTTVNVGGVGYHYDPSRGTWVKDQLPPQATGMSLKPYIPTNPANYNPTVSAAGVTGLSPGQLPHMASAFTPTVKPPTLPGSGMYNYNPIVPSDERAKKLSDQLDALKEQKDKENDVGRSSSYLDSLQKTKADEADKLKNSALAIYPELTQPTEPIGPRVADMRGSPGYFYQYRDPNMGEGQQYGPMAQDLAQHPTTAPAVVQRPDGYLGVDTGKLALANTAAISEEQKRNDELARQLEELRKQKEMESAALGLR